MAALGLLDGVPCCTDLTTRPLLERRGQAVLDQAFHAEGNVATAGGCLASQYTAAWIISRNLGIERAASVIRHAAPIGQQDEYVARAIATIRPFLADTSEPQEAAPRSEQRSPEPIRLS